MADTIHAADVKPRRRGRRLLKILGILLLLLLVLVALAPTLISAGLGRGMIRGAIADNVNGDVQLAGLRVGWFGAQKVEGLRIVDAAGKEAANVSVQVDNGLLALALGRAKPIHVTISGSAAGEIREDGSISFADLVKSKPEKPREPKPSTPAPKPAPTRDAIPPAVIDIAGLNVRLDDQRSKQSLKIDNLTGKVAYTDPAQPITLDLHGKTQVESAGRSESGAIDITGQADGLFAQDGSITLRGASAKLDVKASGLPLPVALQGKPATLQGVAINVASDDLTERIVLSVDGDARIGDAAKPTHFKADGSFGKIVDAAGKPSLRAATANVNVEATNIPIESTDVRGQMDRLVATIVSEDLTRKIEIAAEGQGMINDNQPSTLNANIALAEAFSPNGTFRFAIENLTGSASGRNVPTSLAQPALAATGIDVARDLGPTVDLEAAFPGGIVGGGGDLMVKATAPKAQAEVTAKINADQSISGSRLLLNIPAADPGLIAALTKDGVNTDRPVAVNLNLTSFHLPAPDADTKVRAMTGIGATGTLQLTGPALVRPGASAAAATTTPATQPIEPSSIALERLELNIDSPALAQGVAVKGTGAVGGGSIAIDQRITNLFDSNGVLAIAGAKPAGTVKIDNVPADTIVAFAPPEQADLIRQIVGRALSANVATTPVDSGLGAEVTARSDVLSADIRMVARDDKSLQLDRTVIDATVTPDLAALLQKTSANPVVLGAPTKVHVDLKAVRLRSLDAAGLFAEPLIGHVTLADAMIAKGPGIAETLAIPALAADLTLVKKDDVLTATLANGSATLKRGEAKHDLAQMTIAGTIAMKPVGIEPNLDVRLADLNTRQAEAVMGMTPGAIANWTGDTGSLDLHVETVEGGYRATATPALPNLQGTFTASMRGDMVAITADTSRLVLAKQALQARMNPPADAASTAAAPKSNAAPATAEPAVIVEADVLMQMAITRFEFPMKMLNGEAFDAAAVNIDLAMTGGPLKTSTDAGIKSTLSDLHVSLRVADISKGVQFAIKGQAEAIVPQPPLPPPPEQRDEPRAPIELRPPNTPPDESLTPEQRREQRREERQRERATSRPEASQPEAPAQPAPTAVASSQPQHGSIDVTGTLANVVSSEGKLDLAHGRLQMNAKADNVPTAVADALGDMQGLLVAAVGPQMNATFVADDFSANSGTLDAKITTTNGSLQGLLRGRESSFRVNKNNPVTAELEITPALRERLLMKIHPILADIRTTEHPLRIEIPGALAAIPADVSKLRAEINIAVGKVDLDSGSTTLQILSFFGHGDRATIPGEIEPIAAQIRNGIVTYDKFAVHIDRYTLNYSGQIDLVKQEVNLRTEIPLKALGQQIEQLAGYADQIVVPLVTRGKFGAVKTTIDPDFDLAKAALNAGFKGGLGDLLGGDAGSLLDQLLNKDKGKQPDSLAEPERPRRRDRQATQPTTQPE